MLPLLQVVNTESERLWASGNEGGFNIPPVDLQVRFRGFQRIVEQLLLFNKHVKALLRPLLQVETQT